MQKLNLFILWLAINIIAGPIFAQNLPKNEIVIKTSLYNFFDGSPIVQTNSHLWQHKLVNGFGIAYNRSINNQHHWSIALNTFYFINTTTFQDMKSGDVLLRSFLYGAGAYHNNFFTKNNHKLFWNLGAGIRVGNESYFADLYTNNTWSEVSARTKVLLDLGLSAGLNYKYNLGKTRFNLNASLQATIFPYTYDKKEANYYFDVAPNWKMADLSIGVGYYFGKSISQ